MSFVDENEAMKNILIVHAFQAFVRDILGPGCRSIVWVQGCSLHCKGCILPEAWNKYGGYEVAPDKLAKDILANENIEGLTVSGGEPMDQPEAVAQLLKLVKYGGKNTWVYTGYTLEELVARNDSAIDDILAYSDVLVDGHYDEAQVGSYLFRGSANQRILHLTSAIPKERLLSIKSSVQVQIDDKGKLIIIGVPPKGFLANLEQGLERQGVHLVFTAAGFGKIG